ncbi:MULTISPECIES: peptidoglycan-binding domain-containing protein [unclassified Streptomyces]|uniref:peptidoglycan-binding domain-containing protein n=1 Tax=unclassified Streptomyces TaxID=2593676 RepID=UPI0036F6773E
MAGATAVVGLVVGTLVGAGAGFAASVPAERQETSVGTFGALATNNLGLSSGQAKNLQLWLSVHYGYTGPIDGLLGTNSWKALQRHLQNWDYNDPIDGIPGPNTIRALQRYLKDVWDYRGPIDGIAGPDTRAEFAKFAGSVGD